MDASQRAETVNLAEQHFNHHQFDQADQLARRVLQSFPDCPQSLQVVGLVHASCHRLLPAIETLEKALQIRSDLVPAQNYLGMMYGAMGRLDQAMQCFRRAILLDPLHPHARFNRALLLLKTGDFAEGWTEYEWRWKATAAQRPSIPVPRWDGRTLEGQSILIHTEQGIGDTIQFARFLPSVKQLGATVWFACPSRVKPLLADLDGVDHWLPIDEPAPIEFDVYSPLLSLPALLETNREADFAGDLPLLTPDPERVDRWRAKLDCLPGLKVGLGWQGSPTFVGDHWRSIPLAELSPLGNVKEVSWISLQRASETETPLAGGEAAFPIETFSDVDTDGAFVDSVAMMQSMDLVITTDTALAHVAAASGVPVWVLLSTACDWRWQVGRNDSPWYPSMRLFRQNRLGDWSSVIGDVIEGLTLFQQRPLPR